MQIKSIGEIALIVKKRRKELSLTQLTLARLCNVGVRFLSDLENAKPTCRLDKIFKVLNGLGIRLEVLDE
jgi:y4mF family transcriptional regulator